MISGPPSFTQALTESVLAFPSGFSSLFRFPGGPLLFVPSFSTFHSFSWLLLGLLFSMEWWSIFFKIRKIIYGEQPSIASLRAIEVLRFPAFIGIASFGWAITLSIYLSREWTHFTHPQRGCINVPRSPFSTCVQGASYSESSESTESPQFSCI